MSMSAAQYDYYSAIGDAPIGFLSLGSPMLVGAVLTGVAGTGAVGTLESSISVTPTGLSSTAAIGTPTVAPNTQITIVVGQGATAIQGFVQAITGPNTTNVGPITALPITAHIGAVSIKHEAVLIGQAATAQIGIPAGVVFAEGMFLTDLTVISIPPPVTDVALNIRWSDTEGYSWSDSVQRTIGNTGAYLTSIQVRRLGMSRRGRVFELSWDSPSPTALMGASIMFEDNGT
jgi:hypothetical protein